MGVADLATLVNIALIRLGANTISALGDGSRNGNIVDAMYLPTLKSVMRAHEWNFLTRRAYLDEVAANVLTITGVTQANPGIVSFTGTDPVNGDAYTIASVVGMTELNGNDYVIANLVASTSFELMDTSTSAYTAYTSGGTATQKIPASDDFDYIYVLPSDYLRVLEINEDPDTEFVIEENKYLLTNEEANPLLRYLKYEIDPTNYDDNFVEAYVAKLAADIAIAVTGKRSKRTDNFKDYLIALNTAKVIDAKEKHKELDDSDEFITARQ